MCIWVDSLRLEQAALSSDTGTWPGSNCGLLAKMVLCCGLVSGQSSDSTLPSSPGRRMCWVGTSRGSARGVWTVDCTNGGLGFSDHRERAGLPPVGVG